MSRHLIGLIADTHGLVRPGVHRALEGVEVILHAGDVGGEEVLAELSAIAPVRAVAGNTDAPGASQLPSELIHNAGELSIHVSHGHEFGSPTPEKLIARYDNDVIVYGHTHEPRLQRVAGRLVVNPGAAGPARFRVVPSVARLLIDHAEADVEFISLTGDDG